MARRRAGDVLERRDQILFLVRVGVLGHEETVRRLVARRREGVVEGSPRGGGVAEDGGALGYLVEVARGEDGAAGSGGERGCGGVGEGEEGEGEEREGGEEIHWGEWYGDRCKLIVVL